MITGNMGSTKNTGTIDKKFLMKLEQDSTMHKSNNVKSKDIKYSENSVPTKTGEKLPKSRTTGIKQVEKLNKEKPNISVNATINKNKIISTVSKNYKSSETKQTVGVSNSKLKNSVNTKNSPQAPQKNLNSSRSTPNNITKRKEQFKTIYSEQKSNRQTAHTEYKSSNASKNSGRTNYNNLALKKIDNKKVIDTVKNSQKSESKKIAIIENDKESDYDYEDDFEDYESDFQECTDSDISGESSEASNRSSIDPLELQYQQNVLKKHSIQYQKNEEEHMLDSGHYELSEAKKRAAAITSMISQYSIPLTESKEKDLRDKDVKKSLPLSSLDEGFEDSRSDDFNKSIHSSQVSHSHYQELQNKTLFDMKTSNMRKRNNRSQELLQMLKLDVMSFSLYEHAPIPYEEFIKNYGRLDAQQIATQTCEDNIDIEVQTELIEYANKLTQFPTVYQKKIENETDDINYINQIKSYIPDAFKLNEFLHRVEPMISSLLKQYGKEGSNFSNSKENNILNESLMDIPMDSVPFLYGRKVLFVSYSELSNKILLTIHAPGNKKMNEIEEREEYILNSCIGCIWDVHSSSVPNKILYSPTLITACCFYTLNQQIVFAGLEDGSVCLWDMKENAMWHQKIICKTSKTELLIRTPTYTTANDLENHAYCSKIIAMYISSIIGSNNSNIIRNDKFLPIQLCTLDENGKMSIWSVINNLTVNSDLGTTQWGKIRLVKSGEKIPSNKDFVKMNLKRNLYNNVQIENNAFGQLYYLENNDNDSINLYSLHIKKPLLELRGFKNGIRSIQWLKSKPFIVLALDNNARILIWNLKKNRFNPDHIITLPELKNITCICLSPWNIDKNMNCQYMALGASSGKVRIFKMKPEFYCTNEEEYLNEIRNFTRYLSEL